MKNKLTKSLAIGLVLILSMILSACNATANADDKVELEVWLTPQWEGVYSANEEGADYDSFLKEAARQYTEENPDVTIDVQVIPSDQRDSKLSVGLATETLPNIFFDSTFSLTAWPHQGITLPLDDVISEESREDISDTVWNNVMIDGETHYYPFAQNQGTLVYNADMFKEAGLEEYIADENAIANWSVEDFTHILTTLKEEIPDVTPLGFYAMNNQGDTWTMMYLRMFGNEFYGENNELIVNEPDGVQALEYIKELDNQGLIVSGAESMTSNEVSALFQNQEVAVSFTNTVLYNNMLLDMEEGAVQPFDARLVNVPTVEGVTPPVFSYVLGSMVFDVLDEEENEVAKDFVKFYSEDEELINASTNTLPVRESVSEKYKDELPLLEAFNANEANIINFTNNMAGYAEFRNIFYPEIQAVLIDAKTPQQALDDLVANGNEIISRGDRMSLLIDTPEDPENEGE